MLQELKKETKDVNATHVIEVGDFNEDTNIKIFNSLWLKWDYMKCLVKFIKLKKTIDM